MKPHPTVLAYLAATALTATSAPLTFIAPANVSGDTDVTAVGTGLAAYAWSSNQTVNNVTFTKTTVGTGTLGSYFSFAGLGTANASAFTSTAAPFLNLSTAYKALLVGSNYGAVNSIGTVSINGLTPGHQYLVQAWVGDPRSGTATRVETLSSTGGNSVPFDFNVGNVAGGIGQHAIGLFTADGGSNSFTLASSGSTNLPQINAIQLREITNFGWWSGTGGSNWDVGTTLNFSKDAAGTTGTYNESRTAVPQVIFADTRTLGGAAVANATVNVVGGGITGANVTFLNSALAYTLTSSDTTGITGAQSVVLQGGGNVTFAGSNTYTGVTSIYSGKLILASGSALADGSGVILADSATAALQLNTSETIGALSGGGASGGNINLQGNVLTVGDATNTTYAGVLSGSGGALVKQGGGTLTLTGTNTYTGGTTVNAGTLKVPTALALANHSTAGKVTVAGAATLALNYGGSSDWTSVAVDGLLSGNGSGFAAGSNLALDTTNGNGSYASGIGVTTLGLTKLGANTLTLSGASSYTGVTNIFSGTLALSGGDDRLASTGALTFGGAGTLSLDSNNQTIAALTVANPVTGSITGTGTATLTVNGAANLSVGCTAGGTSTLDLSGLPNFVFNSPANNFVVGGQWNGTANSAGIVTLAPISSITASNLAVQNVAPSSTGAAIINSGTLNLGLTTSLNANTISIATSGRDTGTVRYAAPIATPTLTIRAADGIGRANINMGVRTTVYGANHAATIDLTTNATNGTLDALVGTLSIGNYSRGNGQTQTNLFQMGTGTLDATTINLGSLANNNGNTGILNSTLTVTGGTVKVSTLTVGTHSDANGTLNSAFNLNGGGTLAAQTIQIGAGVANRSINWNDGTLRNYDATTDLAIAATVPIKLAATGTHGFLVDANRTATVAAVLADATTGGTLGKTGAGTLVLSGANTYTGQTTVNAGTLTVTGSLATSGVTLTGGALSLQNAAPTALTIPTFTQTTGNLILDIGGSNNDTLAVTGAYNYAAGEIQILLNADPGTGSHDLVTYGTLAGTPTITIPNSRFTAVPSYGSGTADKISVTLAGAPANLTWTGSAGSAWDLNATQNWNNSGADVFKVIDHVTFADGAANLNPILSGVIPPSSVSFTNNTDTYTLTGTGIVGAGTLTKSGAGTVILANPNTYTGATTVSDGTLFVTGSLGATTVTVTAPGKLTFSRPDNLVTIGSGFAGNGTLSFLGTGVINQSSFTLTGDSSAFSGLAIADKGRINVDNYTTDLGTASVQVLNAGALYLIAAGTFANPVEITGSGWLENAGLLGAIRLQSGSNASGTITLTGDARIGAYGTTGTLSGSLLESGGARVLELANPSTAANSTITLANTCTSTRAGATTVIGATVVVQSATALGTGPVTVQGNGTAARVTRLELQGVTLANNITLASDAQTSFRGALFASGAALSTVTGTVTVTTAVGNGGHLGAEGGTAAVLRLTGPINSTGPGLMVRIGNVELGGGGNYPTLNHQEGTLRLVADNGVNPAAVLTNATSEACVFDLNGFNQTLAGLAKGSFAGTVTNNGTADATLTVNSTTDSSYAGSLTDGPTNLLSLVKLGSAKLIVSGLNSHSGPTTVTAGTLGGTGSQNSALTVQSGASLAPGASVGSFACSSATFAAGAIVAAELDSSGTPTADSLLAKGNVTIAPTAQLVLTDIASSPSVLPAGTKLVLVDYTGSTLTGTFQNLPEGAEVSVGMNKYLLSYVDSSRITLTANGSASAYRLWATGYGLNPDTTGAPGADVDMDGWSNLLEFVLGGNPTLADTAMIAPTATRVDGNLVYSFKRSDASESEVALTVQYGNDLTGWTDVAIGATGGSVGGASYTVDEGTPATVPDTVVVTIPTAGTGKWFVRLKAVKP